MEVKVIFNNEAISSKLSKGWGFSCLVDDRVLFDSGEKAGSLFSNMACIDIDISSIEIVVISHDHWDHTGGLWELLKKRSGIKVYACYGFSREFKEKVKRAGAELQETKEVTEVVKDIYVTGEITGRYKGGYIAEEALVVKTKQGLTVITGCSHPGIVPITEKVKERFPEEKINLVFGGFHLMDKDKRQIRIIAGKLKDIGVEKVGPAHCTGDEAQVIFREVYGDNFISIKAGQVFEV